MDAIFDAFLEVNGFSIDNSDMTMYLKGNWRKGGGLNDTIRRGQGLMSLMS